jgi:HTH-type transcriptional regulator, sugar sensing transcriptional regulator
MAGEPVDNLVKIGFSEYEAKAYVALLRKNPVTGYELSKLSGVPRSMIYEVLGKLTARGAAITLYKEGVTKHAPMPAAELLEKLRQEYEGVISSLQADLVALTATSDLEYVWNIEGEDNVVAKAREAISQAQSRIHLALSPVVFSPLKPALREAIERGLRVVVYTTSPLELPGGQVVIASMPEEAEDRAGGLGLILVIDGEEVLIGEWLTTSQARASWTRSPLLVFIAEHHLRTDPYLPQILALLGDRAMEVIQEEDRDLFAHALESHISSSLKK